MQRFTESLLHKVFTCLLWYHFKRLAICIYNEPSSVASPICQEGQSERAFPILCLFIPIFPLVSRFFSVFPCFSRFLANFSLSGMALCPPTLNPTMTTPLNKPFRKIDLKKIKAEQKSWPACNRLTESNSIRIYFCSLYIYYNDTSTIHCCIRSLREGKHCLRKRNKTFR